MRTSDLGSLARRVLAAIVSSSPPRAALQSLQAFIQPPRFEQDHQSRSEIRLAAARRATLAITSTADREACALHRVPSRSPA